MLNFLEKLDKRWFHRAFVYSGSVTELKKGIDFRYRFAQDTSDKEAPKITAATYSARCYELADDVEEESFPWTDEGVEALKAWVQARYDAYVQRIAE